jgi:hypothetical protein
MAEESAGFRGGDRQMKERLGSGDLRVRDPNRKPVALGQSNVEECGNPMIPINDFNLLVSRDYGYGLGNGLVNANKFCICPKPLLSVWEICGSCRDAMHAMANDGLNCFPAGETKLDPSKFDIETAPLLSWKEAKQHSVHGQLVDHAKLVKRKVART